MALSELAAVEAAYQVLHPLDAAGRRRALQWLSDALGAEGPPPSAGPADGEPVPEPATKPATARASRQRATTKAPAATAAASVTGRPRRVRAARQAATPVEGRQRAYRRMPPADEVMATYEQVGSVSGIADHFGVPRHTAQGWARQLRKQGHAIGRAT